MVSVFVISTFLLSAVPGGSGVYADESPEAETPMSNEQFRRHLETTSAETFAHWTPDRSSKAIPLELKLGSSSDSEGEAYLAGYGSYAQFFVQGTQDNSTSTVNHGEDEVIRSRYLSVLNDVNKVNVEGVSMRDRRAHKLDKASSKGLRGQRHHKQTDERTLEFITRDVISLDSISFTDTTASLPQDADVQDYGMPSSLTVRDLKRNKKDRSDNKMKQESDNTNKNKKKDKDSENTSKKKKDNESENNNKKKDNGQKTANKKKKQKGMKRPQITSVSPSSDAGINDSQDFTIVAEPSPLTDSPIENVLFQIIDHKGTASSWIEVPKIGNNKYQLTIDGFAKHKGTKWRYKVIVEDSSGKKGTTGDISVTVNGVGDTNDSFVDESTTPTHAPPSSPSSKSPPAPAQAMRKQVVSDNNWPHGGNIQQATGKILFEFRGQGDFVCSGTVIMDGSNGASPNTRNGRSIIQTAAHCVYNDVLKEFATKAMFIPDQASTKGDSSNTNCDDDKHGCWKLSFGVVSQGWAESQFPENVAYDYAYYVVHDDPATHAGGYLRGLTGILDQDVDAVKIDFDYRVKDFTFALGYSSEHDPNYRYCAMDQSTIYGVSWYENLWLDQCGLGAGASGGPWIADMDENGVGTLFSINSWGFDNKIGVAGPNFRTQDGSFAECLYRKALKANDPGRKGGYVVSC